MLFPKLKHIKIRKGDIVITEGEFEAYTDEVSVSDETRFEHWNDDDYPKISIFVFQSLMDSYPLIKSS